MLVVAEVLMSHVHSCSASPAGSESRRVMGHMVPGHMVPRHSVPGHTIPRHKVPRYSVTGHMVTGHSVTGDSVTREPGERLLGLNPALPPAARLWPCYPTSVRWFLLSKVQRTLSAW